MTNQPPTAGGPAAAPPATDPLASALRDATADTHEILGEIGRSPSNVVAYLARRRETEELVALQLVPDVAAGGVANYALTEHRELDDAVPSPRDACRVCQVPIPGWGRRCAVCGSEEPVVIDGTTPGTTRAELLEAVRGSTAGRYEVLGDICRAGGGGPVYFARELPSGQLTALRLLREGGGRPGGTQSYSLVAVPLLPSVQSGPSALPGVGGAGGVGGPPVSATGRVGVTWLFQGQAPGEERSDGAPTPGGTLGGATNAGGPPAKVCPQCGATYPVDVMFCPTDGAALRPIAATTSLIGQIIADRFHVLAKLGEGGMGQVYLAEHVQLGRRCAVKLMRQALTDDAEAAARFRREAKNASEIAHPNVATVFDFGATSDGLTYLVMEYVDGEPLSSTLAREGPLEPARVATIARQVAEALAAAHALGIVHRDLKPDNIMLAVGRDGREMVKVVDFGIAKAMEGVTQQVTRTGYRIGTPAYMSPEQIRGDALDGRSDLYSLGCILFELLTGRPPFEGEIGEIVAGRRLTEEPPRPRDVDRTIPRALDEIVARLLRRAPEERYASAEELAAALAATSVGGESGGWRLPFGTARRPARTGGGSVPASGGITITGVEHRIPSGPLRTPPPVPQSPAVARPITTSTTSAPAGASRRARPPQRGRRTLIAASGGVLAMAAVAAFLLTRPDGDAAGSRPAGAAGDTLPATAPAPIPTAPTPVTPPAATAADSAAPGGAAPPQTTPGGDRAGGAAVASPPVPPPAPPPRAADRAPSSSVAAPPRTPSAGAPGAAPAPAADRGTAPVPPPPVTPPNAPESSAASTAAPAPTTGESPESTAAAAAAERARVQQVILQYIQAFDARDANAARRLYPGVDTRAMEAKQMTNWSAKIIEPPVVTVRGSSAEATFTYELAFFHPQTGMSRTTLEAHAILQRGDDGWRIQRLDAVPRR